MMQKIFSSPKSILVPFSSVLNMESLQSQMKLLLSPSTKSWHVLEKLAFSMVWLNMLVESVYRIDEIKIDYQSSVMSLLIIH